MPTGYQHSTRTIIQRLLISLGSGTLPILNQDWPIFSGTEPDSPDNCITISNTQGFDFGRSNIDGERIEHPGFQIRIRCNDEEQGEAKLGEIITTLDKEILYSTVTIEGIIYCVHMVRRTSTIDTPIEIPNSNRVVFFINCVTHLTKIDS